MYLIEVLDQVVTERDLEKCTVAQYKRAILRFSEWLTKPAETADLTIDNLNRWIMHLQTYLSGTTARNYRVSITLLWNFLTETNGMIAYEVRRLRKPKQVAKPVYAWSLDDFSILLKTAKQIEGRVYRSISAQDYLSAWLWFGYDTGLRSYDIRSVEWSAIDLHKGCVTLSQHKTSNPHRAAIGPDTVDALRAILLPERVKVFPLSKGGMRRWELLLYRAAQSNGFARRKGQGLGTLRKTHATEVYIEEGEEAAAESLGHVGGVRTVRRSYIDHRAVRQGRLPRRPNGRTESDTD